MNDHSHYFVSQFSQAEKNHHQQLLEWCSLLKHMDIGVDSLRRQVREQTRKNQPQSLSIVQQGRLGGTGSARKPFPPPAGPSTYYPSTPGTVRAPTESVPMTPTSDRGSNPTSAMKQVSMGYRSPGFGSGPVYAYSANKDSFGSPTPQSVPGSANRPRRSAYMAQASPAGKTLSFGSVGNNVSLPYNSVGSGRKFVGASLSSPMPAQNQMMQSLVQSQERLDKFAVQDESMDSQVHSLEGHLNVQQNVLEISDANLGALEERVSTMKGRVKHS